MAEIGAVELLTQTEVPFYFNPSDKFAWKALENFNLLAITYTSDLTGNDFQQVTKEVEVGLKLLETGQMAAAERRVSYNLISRIPVVEIVCDLTATDSHLLLNVFVRFANSQSSTFVFSCPCGDCEYEEIDELQEEVEVSTGSLYYSQTISFMKASSLYNGRYCLSIFLNDGEFILFEMTVKENSYKPSGLKIHCVRYFLRDRKLNVYENLSFTWTSVDFSPIREDMAVIGNASTFYFSYVYLIILDITSLTVAADTELKGVYFVADAKYSLMGNFLFALCTGQADNGHGIEDFNAVFVWDTWGNLLQEIDLALPSYELCLSPHDSYIAISQCGVDFYGRQLTVFLKHTLNLSKPEAKFDAEEMVRIYHEEEKENDIRFSISPSGHQMMVTHSWRKNMEDQREELSNLLLYKMDTSPPQLRVLCRVAVRRHYAVHNLTRRDVPGEILSFLHWR